MVGTGVEVRLHARRHRVDVAPCADRVDQSVVATVGEVLGTEAEAGKVGRVVGQPEVRRRVPTRDLASRSRVRGQDADLFGNEQLAGPKNLPGLRGVLGGTK